MRLLTRIIGIIVSVGALRVFTGRAFHILRQVTNIDFGTRGKDYVVPRFRGGQ